MTYRILDTTEWWKLEQIFARHGQSATIPHPEASIAAVAEQDGEIAGILFLQIALHVEPLIIENPRVDFRRLLGEIEQSLAEKKGLPYYCFTESEHVERMAQIVGMKKLPYAIWFKEVA